MSGGEPNCAHRKYTSIESISFHAERKSGFQKCLTSTGLNTMMGKYLAYHVIACDQSWGGGGGGTCILKVSRYMPLARV